MMKTALKAVYAGLTLSLAACGGGVNTTLSVGPSVNLSVTNPSFPFASAVSTFLQSKHDYTLNATSGTDVYELSWHSEPGAQKVFGGQLASTLNYTTTITRNGLRIAGSSLTDYFDLIPFRPLGGLNLTLGNVDVASNQQALPSLALPGQSGLLSYGTRFADSTMVSTLASSVTHWSLESAGLLLAWACMNSSITATGAKSPGTGESICYKIDTSGNTQGFKIILSLNGQTLTFE